MTSTSGRRPEHGVWDVAVIGAGPAGTRAAAAAARQGVSVILLDKATLPRYKTCGGGLTGMALAALGGPAGRLDPRLPSRDVIRRVEFTHEGRSRAVATYPDPIMVTVVRDEFDAALATGAAADGVEVHAAVSARRLREDEDGVVVDTTAGPVRAQAVVGADGTGGRVAQYVGVTYRQVDLGLEVELRLTAAQAERWRGAIALDWGPLPGSYAWLFPKAGTATVGVIAERGNPDELRAYLTDWTGRLDLTEAPVQRSSGHLTRTRAAGAPSVRGRVFVAGDAAGLVEPWTREGISYALRSGERAGLAAARIARSDDDVVAAEGRSYEQWLNAEIEPELAAGAVLYGAFSRNPRAVHRLIAHTERGRRAFGEVSRGEKRFSQALRHRPVRIALRLLGG